MGILKRLFSDASPHSMDFEHAFAERLRTSSPSTVSPVKAIHAQLQASSFKPKTTTGTVRPTQVRTHQIPSRIQDEMSQVTPTRCKVHDFHHRSCIFCVWVSRGQSPFFVAPSFTGSSLHSRGLGLDDCGTYVELTGNSGSLGLGGARLLVHLSCLKQATGCELEVLEELLVVETFTA
ncbi:hypothetical protein MSAN_00978500 [Mycena sanguinolenta]|uniref:Uncharacterized protein n=1 Tax=Mycena sanguinolenta TaxID=230812 RepID=A0A8H6YYL4_9AGAR|nr:hypothetical protein MSAN_00978500 [Mycena sanguinolenta]